MIVIRKNLVSCSIERSLWTMSESEPMANPASSPPPMNSLMTQATLYWMHMKSHRRCPPDAKAEPGIQQKVYFEGEGWIQTSVYELDTMPPGCRVPGPALIIDNMTSILIEPHCLAHLTEEKNVRIDISQKNLSGPLSETSDPVQLAIFSHRYAHWCPIH